MAAICDCLNRNHRPFVDVGNPEMSENNEDTIFMQVIDIPKSLITDSSEVRCIDKTGTVKSVSVSWLLSFSCDFCSYHLQ